MTIMDLYMYSCKVCFNKYLLINLQNKQVTELDGLKRYLDFKEEEEK